MYHTFAMGDHLVTERNAFEHHGIYAGGGRVIHYLREGVSSASLETFTRGRKVWVEPHHSAEYSPAAAVKRAEERLHEDEYNLITCNCEHFVNWCIDDESKSSQVERGACILGGLLATGLAIYGMSQFFSRGNVGLEEGPASFTRM